jgi:hypothetical protein
VRLPHPLSVLSRKTAKNQARDDVPGFPLVMNIFFRKIVVSPEGFEPSTH